MTPPDGQMADCSEAAVTVSPRISEIPAAGWDAIANPDPVAFNPFVAHAFLNALEQSGSVGDGTGWLPQHLTIAGAGGIAAAAPMYVKLHSQGEYVFDYGWADAYQRAGGGYYPKLQISVPFTPVPGPRLLGGDGPDAHANEQLLAAAAIALAEQHGLSSVHATFLDRDAAKRLGGLGYLTRVGQQFHWLNGGYRTFDDFLATLASRKRKAVKKERAEVADAGISIELVSGRDITEAHWDAMFAFYMDTGSRKWGRPYLNRAFFSLIGEKMADRCLLIFARRNDRHIAGALNLIGGDCLYGRYWGAIEHHASLHFEVCYYQAIEYAIRHCLARVEAGAQGEHKLARGYLPVETYSAHWIADPSLRKAVERFLKQERELIRLENASLTDLGPYRKDGALSSVRDSEAE